jgi:hypothetical protein
VGTVFEFDHDERPKRVLMHDAEVVMYDGWRPHLDSWSLGDLRAVRRKGIHYYVTTVDVVIEKARYLRADPLTTDEVDLHRPDLPFAIAQCPSLSWSAETNEAVTTMAERWAASLGLDASKALLKAPEIYLYPFGPGGGEKTGIRVEAENGSAFTIPELLQKAAAIQAPWASSPPHVQGVGIYRAGLNRGIPAYYLWGSESKVTQ